MGGMIMQEPIDECSYCKGTGRIPFDLVPYWHGEDRPLDRECDMCFGTGERRLGLVLARVDADRNVIDRIIGVVGIRNFISDVLRLHFGEESSGETDVQSQVPPGVEEVNSDGN
jgi:hypothetical protein